MADSVLIPKIGYLNQNSSNLIWLVPGTGYTKLNDGSEPAPEAPTITANPSNQTVTEGATATFTSSASGVPSPTYQWQRNPLGSGSWADIGGATSASYTTPATTVTGGSANNTDQYRSVATNTEGSATSTAATLTVNAAAAASKGRMYYQLLNGTRNV